MSHLLKYVVVNFRRQCLTDQIKRFTHTFQLHLVQIFRKLTTNMGAAISVQLGAKHGLADAP